MTPSRTCEFCVHFTDTRPKYWIGSCALGGPDPSQGCSDVNRTETCEKWAEKPKEGA